MRLKRIKYLGVWADYCLVQRRHREVKGDLYFSCTVTQVFSQLPFLYAPCNFILIRPFQMKAEETQDEFSVASINGTPKARGKTLGLRPSLGSLLA